MMMMKNDLETDMPDFHIIFYDIFFIKCSEHLTAVCLKTVHRHIEYSSFIDDEDIMSSSAIQV